MTAPETAIIPIATPEDVRRIVREELAAALAAPQLDDLSGPSAMVSHDLQVSHEPALPERILAEVDGEIIVSATSNGGVVFLTWTIAIAGIDAELNVFEAADAVREAVRQLAGLVMQARGGAQ